VQRAWARRASRAHARRLDAAAVARSAVLSAGVSSTVVSASSPPWPRSAPTSSEATSRWSSPCTRCSATCARPPRRCAGRGSLHEGRGRRLALRHCRWLRTHARRRCCWPEPGSRRIRAWRRVGHGGPHKGRGSHRAWRRCCWLRTHTRRRHCWPVQPEGTSSQLCLQQHQLQLDLWQSPTLPACSPRAPRPGLEQPPWAAAMRSVQRAWDRRASRAHARRLDAAAVARSAVLNSIVVAPGSSTPCATRRGGASQPFALRDASWGRQPAVHLLRLCGCAQTTRDLRPTHRIYPSASRTTLGLCHHHRWEPDTRLAAGGMNTIYIHLHLFRRHEYRYSIFFSPPAKYDIIFNLGPPCEYVNTYSTRRSRSR